MKLHFDSKQGFQLEAVKAITICLKNRFGKLLTTEKEYESN